MRLRPSLAERIVKRAMKGKSLAKFQSDAYYLEDLAKCIHLQCKSYEDAKKSVQKTKKKIHCVYVRFPSSGEEISKIGKGTIKKQKNGKVFLSRDTEMSSSPGVLKNEIVIPCDNELSAFILEYALQWFYGMKRTPRSLAPSTYKAIQTKVPQRFTDWIKPDIDENYQQGGSEWFGRYITKDEIKEVLHEITQSVGLGRQDYRGLAFDYQLEAKKIMLDYALAVTDPVLAIKDCKDFWLLMKPRAFKNCTIALGIASIVERMFELGRLESQTVDILVSGLWPSAFEGMKKDIDDHTFSETISISYVDTRDSDWREQRTQKIKEGYDVIFLFASMQSIDEAVSQEIENNIDLQEEDGVEAEKIDSDKLNALLGLNIKFAILDECDHGLRTPNSTRVLNKFNFLLRFQMSGSDLQALNTEIKDGNDTLPQNYFARTIIDETRDVLDPNHPLERPLIRWWGFEEGRLPFENLLPEEMDEIGISRRMRSMFTTHTNEKAEKAKTHDAKKRIMKYRMDKKDELRYDGDGEVVTGTNPREFKRLIQRLEQATDNTDAEFLNHQHIFMTVPTKAGGMALYNYLKINNPDWDRKVATGWDFKNELEVRQFMGITDKNKKGSHKTLIIVVAKMLRGSNPPWSLVIRCDDYKDFKISHQIDLRSQNACGPDGRHSDVLDLNTFRVIRNAPQIAKLNSKKGQTNKILDSKVLTRFLPYMIGKVTAKQITMDKAEDIHNTFESITYGFNKDNLFDKEGLTKNKEQLVNIGETIPDYDATDPKQGKTFKKKEKKEKKEKKSLGEKDLESEEMKKLLAKAKSLANYLPLLQYLNKILYDNIDDLVRKTPHKVIIPWLNYCGLSHNQTNLDLLIEIFDLEQINTQLRFTSKKIKRGLTINEITKISRPKAGDVPMPLTLAYEIVGKIPNEVWNRPNLKILDWSCGKGELLVAIKDKLTALGITKEKIQDSLEYGDINQLNVAITNKVLGFDKGFCYNLNRNDPKDKNVFKFLEEKLKGMKFDIVLTNPPYQWASDDDSGRDTKNNRENLWTRGVTMSFERLSKDNGYVAMVTPPSWRTASYDYGNTSILRDYFRPNNVITINLDECKKHFKVGSDFSYWIVEKGTTGKKTELVTLAGATKVNLNSGTFDYGLPRDYENDVIELVGEFLSDDREKINLSKQYYGAVDPNWLRTDDKIDKDLSDDEILQKYKLDKDSINKIVKSKKGKNIFFKGKYKQYHTLATKEYTYCDATSSKDVSLYNKPKAMLSMSGTYKWVADASGEIVIGHYVLSRLLEQGEKIEYIMQVLNSSVYQFMCYQFRSSGFINGKFLSKLPNLDFTRSWTEDQIRDEFKVSDRIRKILDDEYDN